LTKSKNITTIELLNFLKQLRLLNERIDLPVNSYNEIEKAILDEIGQSKETITKRLEGLKAEDEFLLMCIVLGSMDNVIPLPQKKYLDKEYTIPDFLISIKKDKELNNLINNHDTILVETKKMRENEKEYVISMNYMDKLKEYAQILNYPLFFAIKANLVEYNFFQWMLVPSTFIENKGIIKKTKIHGGRNEKCYVIDVLDLLTNDHSGLWFYNYSIMLQKGTQYIRNYTKNKKTCLRDEKLGYITKISLKRGDYSKIAEFSESIDDNRNLVFYELCGFLCSGTVKEIKGDDSSSVVVEADYNYYIPFYHILVKTYLEIRKDFYMAVDGIEIDDISYYIENFSIMDQNIVAYIKDIMFELEKLNIVMIIRVMPSDFP